MVGNSDVWGMQCFCSVVFKWFLRMTVGHAQKQVQKATLQKHCIPQPLITMTHY